MQRRTMLQAGGLAAIGAVAAGCHKINLPVLHQPASDTGSLPPTFFVGSGQGLQLFFNGLCAFVLPKATGDSLRVAMLNGYPDQPLHRHYPSLVVPRLGLDIAKTTARPAAINTDHVIFGLSDLYATLKVEGVSSPQIKVQNTPQGRGCAIDAKWADFGWVLDMSQFFTGARRDWSKVGSVSQAQFEAAHGSLERDFDHKEQPSPVDRREWKVNGQDRILKQAPRLRILEGGPISLELKPRTGAGSSSVVVFDTVKHSVNAAILHLPIMRMEPQPPGTRLDDALAYYQMLDPSPLNPSNPPSDARLSVPIWSENPDNCQTKASIECTCCPPSGV